MDQPRCYDTSKTGMETRRCKGHALEDKNINRSKERVNLSRKTRVKQEISGLGSEKVL
jgi:hypothetical protein